MIGPAAFAAAKLVVWDLDGTLWHGTLDDDDVPVPTGLHRWIEPLSRAGVMSAVCSNNDPVRGRVELARLGVLKWMVFPQISWSPKEEMLGSILSSARLRAADVLVVDDLARHRQRAIDLFGMRAADPADLSAFDGQLDRTALSPRLAHYRVLERRTTDARRAGDAQAFLEASGVTVTIADALDHVEGIAALSQRANQLNFTGSRLNPSEVRELAARPGIDSGAVWTRDQYGDYGLTGFYARSLDGPLQHFFFSCRVLHLGVEAHVHDRLGRPAFVRRADRVRSEQWRDLAADAGWVRVGTETSPTPPSRPTTLWAGGCDLQILSGLLRGGDDDIWLLPEERGGAQVYARSSLLLLGDPADGDLLDAIPWTHGHLPPPDGWTTLVLSPWVDCACLTYTHRVSGVRIPSYVRLDASSSEWDWNHWWGDNPGRDLFLRDWVPTPPLDESEIISRLLRLTEEVGPERHVVVLTAPEVDNGHEYAWRESQVERHRVFNRALEAAATSSNRLCLADVRSVVRGMDDLHSPHDPVMFHYRRAAYVELATMLAEVLPPPNGTPA
ncbi:hypothetical protein [Nocardioides sp. W7]|uniref:hypothetical protein n=1 Tax=Nocardioides sp. W7 TaxID=2931390 RepID=UPI001FD3B462|nr:hypothetical protein [Nocardioides sp. W7]